MKVTSRIQTRTMYCYIELHGELEEFLSLTKEDMEKIIQKHEGGIKIYNLSQIEK